MELARLSENREAIIASVTRRSVDNYCRIACRFREGAVDRDHDFQRFYAYFYRMTRRGLTQEFKARYFAILEELRDSKRIDVEAIVRELYEYPNSRGRNTLQFSFATKLAHTANSDYAIYDSLVATVFGFKPAYYGEFETRLARLSSFYSRLCKTYAAWGQEPEMQSIIWDFHRAYGTDTSLISDTKVIDFLMWSAGRQPQLCS